MLSDLLLPDSTRLCLADVEINAAENKIILHVHTTSTVSPCPLCEQESQRLHSYYTRHLSDLPCAGRCLQIQLQARKFFCDNVACERKVFTERLPGIVAPWARRTERLYRSQQRVALLMGAEAGHQIASILQMSLSADTLLRLIRKVSLPTPPTPRVLGVDDWALCKGQHYGTILVDLETHTVVELLPERTAETLANWLQDHPGVEIISRDRAGAYAEGARQGAPQAQQVADRWHLLKNLADVLAKELAGYRRKLREIQQPLPVTDAVELDFHPEIAPPGDSPSRQERYEAYQTAIELTRQGISQKAIAQHLKRHPRTIRRWLQADQFPEIHRTGRSSILDPYKDYLLQRWKEGCWNAAQLHREICDQGYGGGATIVRDFVQQVRTAQGIAPGKRCLQEADIGSAPLTPRRAAHLILMKPEDQDEKSQQIIQQITQLNPDISQLVTLAQAFADMVRQRQVERLDGWLGAAQTLPALRGFARGLRQDESAVRAALSLIWSNGQTEGQINRLKFIKRQMYGRASFDLLRIRVLAS